MKLESALFRVIVWLWLMLIFLVAFTVGHELVHQAIFTYHGVFSEVRWDAVVPCVVPDTASFYRLTPELRTEVYYLQTVHEMLSFYVWILGLVIITGSVLVMRVDGCEEKA